MTNKMKEAAAKYVRESLFDENEVALIRAQTAMCMDMRYPIGTSVDGEIQDLLNDWGEENDMEPDWWCDDDELYEDIVTRI